MKALEVRLQAKRHQTQQAALLRGARVCVHHGVDGGQPRALRPTVARASVMAQPLAQRGDGLLHRLLAGEAVAPPGREVGGQWQPFLRARCVAGVEGRAHAFEVGGGSVAGGRDRKCGGSAVERGSERDRTGPAEPVAEALGEHRAVRRGWRLREAPQQVGEF